MTTPTRRAALYARVSTKDKGQDPEVQLGPLRAEAARQGWRVVGEYVDYQSGTTTSRPRLDQLMGDVDAGRIDVVCVWKFDRFARGVIHLLRSLYRFRERGVDFVSLTEALDTTTPMGRAMFTIIAAIAELERELIVERVHAGLDAARARGVRLGHPPKQIDLRPAQMLLAQGRSIREAAGMLGLSEATLRRRLRAVSQEVDHG